MYSLLCHIRILISCCLTVGSLAIVQIDVTKCQDTTDIDLNLSMTSMYSDVTHHYLYMFPIHAFWHVRVDYTEEKEQDLSQEVVYPYLIVSWFQYT